MTACAEPNVIHLLHGKGHIWLRSTGYVLACLCRVREESGDPAYTVLQNPRPETSPTKVSTSAPRSTSASTNSMRRRFGPWASSTSQGVWSRLVKEADGNPIAVHVECQR